MRESLSTQKDPEAVAKVLLNALYLQSQGKLQNGPGYIRAGIEDGYDLLPQVASRLEGRRGNWRRSSARSRTRRGNRARPTRASRGGGRRLCARTAASRRPEATYRRRPGSPPEPIVRRNPTLSNPFVRGKVYELACGDPVD